MKRVLVAAVALILATASPAARAANTAAVRFTPGDIIGPEIDARRQVLVQAYSFTSAPITAPVLGELFVGLSARYGCARTWHPGTPP